MPLSVPFLIFSHSLSGQYSVHVDFLSLVAICLAVSYNIKNKTNFRKKIMNYTIRKMKETEYSLLNDFLYEAIFIPDGMEAPPKNIIAAPELRVYVDHFGMSKDDHALAAETDGKIVGAIWARIMNDYGHIDDTTPSLAISLYKEYRGRGIGTHLMKEMLSLLRKQGYKQVSLSVQKANYAAKMYRKIGFEIIRETEEEFIMLYSL